MKMSGSAPVSYTRANSYSPQAIATMLKQRNLALAPSYCTQRLVARNNKFGSLGKVRCNHCINSRTINCINASQRNSSCSLRPRKLYWLFYSYVWCCTTPHLFCASCSSENTTVPIFKVLTKSRNSRPTNQLRSSCEGSCCAKLISEKKNNTAGTDCCHWHSFAQWK